MNIPDWIQEILMNSNDDYVITPDGKTLYENFDGTGVREHVGEFNEMTPAQITNYIIEATS